jgi:hypothetical protein
MFGHLSRFPSGRNYNFESGLISGEWVNEWTVPSGSQTDYQQFGKAQLEVYKAASFGWAYWTLKNDRKHWDFEWSIRNSYLQLGSYSRLVWFLF